MDPLHSLDSAGGFGPPGQGFESLRALSNQVQKKSYQILNYIRRFFHWFSMSPGIGLMKRRLETKESAISLAISGITKKFKVQTNEIQCLETKYDDDSGDWYVALGWKDKRVIVKMDSVLATITEIKEI